MESLKVTHFNQNILRNCKRSISGNPAVAAGCPQLHSMLSRTGPGCHVPNRVLRLRMLFVVDAELCSSLPALAIFAKSLVVQQAPVHISLRDRVSARAGVCVRWVLAGFRTSRGTAPSSLRGSCFHCGHAFMYAFDRGRLGWLWIGLLRVVLSDTFLMHKKVI